MADKVPEIRHLIFLFYQINIFLIINIDKQFNKWYNK